MSETMIRLVDDTESLAYKVAGTKTKIFYRRISAERARVLTNLHTKRGELDTDGFSRQLLQEHVMGWENVLDKGNKPIPYNFELIYKLPNPILVDLIGKINGDSYDDEAVKLEKKS